MKKMNDDEKLYVILKHLYSIICKKKETTYKENSIRLTEIPVDVYEDLNELNLTPEDVEFFINKLVKNNYLNPFGDQYDVYSITAEGIHLIKNEQYDDLNKPFVAIDVNVDQSDRSVKGVIFGNNTTGNNNTLKSSSMLEKILNFIKSLFI